MPKQETLNHGRVDADDTGSQLPVSGQEAITYLQERLGKEGVRYTSAIGRDHNGLITLFEGYRADDGSISIGLSNAPMSTRRRLRGLGRNFLGRRAKTGIKK